MCSVYGVCLRIYRENRNIGSRIRLEEILREREIEGRLRDGVKKLGGLCYKFVSPGNRGVPDRIVFLPGGVVYFVELKTETGRLSKIQRVQLKRMERLGVRVRVLYGLSEVNAFLSGIEKEERQ